MHNHANALVSFDALALSVFTHTMQAFLESKVSSYGVGQADYTNNGKGRATNTACSAIIRMEPSDLVADVELAARAVLTEGEQAYFQVHYASGHLVAVPYGDEGCKFSDFVTTWPARLRSAVSKVDRRIRLKVGAELRRRGIAPVSLYLEPVDVRRGDPEANRKRDAVRYKSATTRVEVAA